jgi:hypothetical protein
MISQVLGARSWALTGAILASLVPAGPVRAQTSSVSALIGNVTSQEEGAMEGVLVSAKRVGSTMTITVASNAQGQYSFPQDSSNRAHIPWPSEPWDMSCRAAGRYGWR